MTAITTITRAKALIAVTALLAVVFIATIASCGGPGGSSATGFHDSKLLTASLAYQSHLLQAGGSAVGGAPYGVPCHTRGNTLSCVAEANTATSGRARCPLDIGDTAICQVEDSVGWTNLPVTLSDGGHSYTASAGHAVLSDHLGG